MKKLTTWTEDKEAFQLCIDTNGEWIVTKDNKLIFVSDYQDISEYGLKESDVAYSFYISLLSPHHTTDWLRAFCEEHHPEIDFDSEFETDKAGVFARYQDKFGYDYPEWVAEKQYKMIKEKLTEKNYCLPWSEQPSLRLVVK